MRKAFDFAAFAISIAFFVAFSVFFYIFLFILAGIYEMINQVKR